MKLETAIKQIEKESEFLGMDYYRVLKEIKRIPLAFPKKTVEAMKAIENYKLA